MRFALVVGYQLLRFDGRVMEFVDRSEAMSYARENELTAQAYPILQADEDRIILDGGTFPEVEELLKGDWS